MTPAFLISAFLIGFAGSLHCVGMCGPLMMTGVFKKSDQRFSMFRWIMYHVGRIGIYFIWGMLFGLMGTSVRWFGFQQNISLSLGIGMFVVLILSKVYPQFETAIHNSFPMRLMRAKLTPHVHGGFPFSSFMAGMLNGMLPCGLVYVALAGATAMQNSLAGGVYMAVFGIGNLPMLFAVVMLGRKFQVPLRNIFSRWYPAFIGLMAILLIIRGLNWGNFFSPALIKGKVDTVHCATR